MQKYFIFFLVFSGLLGTPQAAQTFQQKAWCKINKTSRNCKKPGTFEKLVKNKCVAATSTCRQSFCRANCLTTKPTDEALIKLCTYQCNPLEKDVVPVFDSMLTKAERERYYNLYGTRSIIREKEIFENHSNELSRLQWCLDYCDYDETSPSCERSSKAGTWEVCKPQCSFIPDMKKHIEGCLKASKLRE